MKKVIVIGAGPAGVMAALEASKKYDVTLIDGNEKLGKKLFITGKGRCNVTNARDISEFFDFIPGNPHFLYSALYTFTNEDTIKFFEKNGVKLKVERGERVFPQSDKSIDIINGLKRALSHTKVKLMFDSKVTDIKSENNLIKSIIINGKKELAADYFILAAGGASYPSTGSRGEGQKFAEKLGHKIIPLKPSLVPMELKCQEIRDLINLELKNIEIRIKENNKKEVFKDFGEIKFMQFGVSGPLILKGSRYIKEGKKYTLSIDLKPALSEKELDKRIQKDFLKYGKEKYKNSLNDLLPRQMIPVILAKSGIYKEKNVSEITKTERKALTELIKNLEFEILGLRPLSEAIVTAGGVDVKEVDPSTMKSKLIKNLSFCGEILDVDAFTGGYNVQIAFSTGFLAGNKIDI